VTEKDKVVFTRQFATMIEPGLPLVQCLDILSTQAENKKFGRVLGRREGPPSRAARPSPSACGRHPSVFDELYVNSSPPARSGGILDTILDRLWQLHREGHEAQAPGARRHGLPGGHLGRRHRGRHRAAVEGHPRSSSRCSSR
jgi:type II secretory pathway component PulF